MLDDIYNMKIIELASNIANLGRLDNPDATATKVSRLCGSKVTVDIIIKSNVVVEFAHDVKACALGQASSSIMAKNIIGSSKEELFLISKTMEKMLKNDGPVPEGRWSELAFLQPVKDYKSRHSSTMLTFEAVNEALNNIKQK
ncbi:MAG: iron-sulfur cluster assembly scaffold protein [Hyphomicrobiales bacterium]|jgi:NifU-like protein involved in Fe-S cluster formation|nr:iron-sulfur cluster assembly scaffold protein [Hyphomicrobiales bacterium]